MAEQRHGRRQTAYKMAAARATQEPSTMLSFALYSD